MKTNVTPKRMTAQLCTGAMCMASAWILLGIVVVQRYFIVIGNSVYHWYQNRGGGGGLWTVYLLGELPIRWRRMSRGVSCQPAIRLFLKSSFWLSTHETSKLNIISLMLGNHRSWVDKGPASREAFWCQHVMMQVYNVDIIREPCASGPGMGCHSKGWLRVWSYDSGRVISENYTSHMVNSCCNM